MKKVVFLGNCQATRLFVLYNEQFQPITGDTTDLVVNFVEMTDRWRRAMEEADVIVAQVTDTDQKITVDQVRTNARIVWFPYITGAFLWPHSGKPHTRNETLPYLQDGPYGAQYGNLWLNSRIKSGASPEDIAAEYGALDIPKAINLDRTYEISMERARQRDARSGTHIADVIERSLTETPLFMTPANLEMALFRPLATAVYEQLGVSSSAIGAMFDTLWRTPFPVADQPIHPSVAKHFGLKFIGPETRYRTFTGERLTFSEWVARYVRYQWNDDILEGAYRGSRLRRFDAEAEEVLEKVTRGLAQSTGSAYGETSRAHLLRLKGDNEGALAATRRAADFDRGNPQIVATLAIYLVEKGDLDEAENVARDLTERWPFYADGWNRLGVVLARRGRLAEAAEAVARATRLEPRDVSYHKHLSSVLTQAGQRERAKDALTGAIALMPDQAELYADLSRLSAQLGDLDAALVAARQAVARDGGNAAFKALLADILTQRSDFVSAANVLGDAIAVAPQQVSLSNARANLLRQLGKHEEANAENRRGIALEPANIGLRHIFAQSLIRQGAFEEAEAVLTDAIAVDPANDALIAGLTHVLSQQRRFDEAEAIGRKSVQLSPNRAFFHQLLADVLQAAGKLDDAEQSYRAAVALAPEHWDLRGSLALLLNRQGRPDEGLAVIVEAVAGAPGNSHLLAKQSFLLSEKGDFEQAKAVARAAVALSPQFSGLHATLGDICERGGDLEAASSAYKTAVRLDPGNAHYLRQAERLGRLMAPPQSVAAE